MLYILKLPNIICKLYHNKAGKNLWLKNRSKLILTKFLFIYLYCLFKNYLMWKNWGFPGGSVVKHSSAMQETWVRKIPWRRKWLPTPVFLPGDSPWTEEPGSLHSIGPHRVGHDWSNLACTHMLYNAVLVPAKQQGEPIIIAYVPPPFWASLLPPILPL